MNFLPAKAEARRSLRAPGGRPPVARATAARRQGAAVTVGIRPEHLRPVQRRDARWSRAVRDGRAARRRHARALGHGAATVIARVAAQRSASRSDRRCTSPPIPRTSSCSTPRPARGCADDADRAAALALSAPVRASRRRQARAREHAHRDARRPRARLLDGRVRRQARRRQRRVPAARRDARAHDERTRPRRRAAVARAVAPRRRRLALGEVRGRDAAHARGDRALGARARRVRATSRSSPRRDASARRAPPWRSMPRRCGAMPRCRRCCRRSRKTRSRPRATRSPSLPRALLVDELPGDWLDAAGAPGMRRARRQSQAPDARGRRQTAHRERLSRVLLHGRTIRRACASSARGAWTRSSPTRSTRSRPRARRRLKRRLRRRDLRLART